MNFNLRLKTLENMCLVKVAVSISLNELFSNSIKTDFSINWAMLSSNTQNIVMKLTIAVALKETLCGIVKLNEQELKNWYSHWVDLPLPLQTSVITVKHCCLPIIRQDKVMPYLRKIHWLEHGIIDMKATAELVVQDTDLDLVSRYRVAGFYCLEDHVVKLWDQISMVNKEFSDSAFIKRSNDVLTAFFAFCNQGVCSQLSTSLPNKYQIAFKRAAEDGNIDAAQYFWTFLNKDQKARTILDILKCDYHFEKPYGSSQVLRFILQQMNKEEQLMFLRKDYRTYTGNLLFPWPFEELLEFSCYELFFEALKQMWQFMSILRFHNVMLSFQKFMNINRTCINADFVHQFWVQSPYGLRIPYTVAILYGQVLISDNEENLTKVINEWTLVCKSGAWRKTSQEIEDILDRLWYRFSRTDFSSDSFILSNDKSYVLRDLLIYTVKNGKYADMIEALDLWFDKSRTKSSYDKWVTYGRKSLTHFLDRLHTNVLNY